MSSDTVKLLELLLIVGLVLWFGISQLRALKKNGSKPGERDQSGRDDGKK